MAAFLHVMVGVVRDESGRILLTKRHAHQHQGGLWEFPGGKLEVDETPQEALRRELQEEVCITPLQSRPLIQLRHHYQDLSVYLDVWMVDAFCGEPQSAEGQQMQWVSTDKLKHFEFPAANRAIVTALEIGHGVFITPSPTGQASKDAYLANLESVLQKDKCSAVVFRAHELDTDTYCDWACELVALAHGQGRKVILNREIDVLAQVKADGVHLTADRARHLTARPECSRGLLLGVSCHNEEQLRHAQRLEADFALLSPVKHTASHPEVSPLGWAKFAQLVQGVNIPVYALGGMSNEDLPEAAKQGASGVAGISSFY